MSSTPAEAAHESHDVVIVGGGAAGIAAAASLLRRQPELDIVVIEPQTKHYYQPGSTLVGAGVFRAASTERDEAGLIPRRAKWLNAAVAAFAPETNEVILDDGKRIAYRALVAAPGIKLDWAAVEGLPETLGKKGVTSNYRFDLAPYTWQLVRAFRGGRALFTQPPMPISPAMSGSATALSKKQPSSFITRAACSSASRIMSRRSWNISRNMAWHSTSIAALSR